MEIFDIVISALVGAIVPTVISLWAWVKAHAASTEAMWDDEAVAYVEKIAQAIVDKSKK